MIKHCIIVTQIAEDFCNQIPSVDKNLVVAGAMLHDIGRSVTHSILHAVEGVQILEKENINQRVLEIVKKHIGTGITKEEANNLGLPADDYFPRTAEEILVSYSDNLTCGKHQCSFEETLKNFTNEFGADSHVVKGFYNQREFVEQKIGK
ncbi:MAG: HDIG domain-containing protein [Candidatus Heimdallarchaeota archaeon]|nr:HDIG domain-containing protein [Candidatus Heimdallarchaeota archaeon]MCK4954409.1 HDIG domain-containing protein [Candidatus Heimdallarchaeota archaeon]